MSLYGFPNKLPNNLNNCNNDRLFPPVGGGSWRVYSPLFIGDSNTENASMTAPMDNTKTPFSDYDYYEKYGMIPIDDNKFGPYEGHNGTDIVGPEATCPIHSLTSGRVIQLQPSLGGILIEDEFSTNIGRIRYLHMSSISVSVNDSIVKGQIIGFQGNTGTFGFHTHVDRINNNTPNGYDTLLLVLGGKGVPTPKPKPKKVDRSLQMFMLFNQKRRV